MGSFSDAIAAYGNTFLYSDMVKNFGNAPLAVASVETQTPGQRLRRSADWNSKSKRVADFFKFITKILNGFDEGNPRLKRNYEVLSLQDQHVHLYQKRDWFQLGGRAGTFVEGRNPGWIMKLRDDNEFAQYKTIRTLSLAKFTPRYVGVCVMASGAGQVVGRKGRLDSNLNKQSYIEMEDLLAHFTMPNVMDVKMGVRSYREDEINKFQLPNNPEDWFQEIRSEDESALTDKEKETQTVSKEKYLKWRDNVSSTSTLGFRIQAIRKWYEDTKDQYQKLKNREDIKNEIEYFVGSSTKVAAKFVKRLRSLKCTLLLSRYFRRHEVSLLIFMDSQTAKNVVHSIIASFCVR
ncbi:hypothetical protein ACOME3_001458 [Neoechinorhynchus agilis]